MSFKKDFIWGAATAAYQIEGAAFDDGKGLSVWDVFSHTKGEMYREHNGDISCDHYNRLEDDLEIMSGLGLKSYRFSISWPRLLPNGIGEINEKGVNFYNRLIDGLLKRGITPCATLFHWDLPYTLHLKGGWLNDESPKWFEEYASLVKQRFGDRVHDFITFNEPQAFVGNGYLKGTHAPGLKLNRAELLRIVHNILKAHGMAVMALRNGEKCRIGLTGASYVRMPYSCSDNDIEAARQDYFSSDFDDFVNYDAVWFDPAIKGIYPNWVYEYNGIGKPLIKDSDMKIINQPIDFIGLNIYTGVYVSEKQGQLSEVNGAPRTAMYWNITPEALYWGPRYYWERYGKPIMITENGMPSDDWTAIDGKIHDEARIDYMRRYLLNLKKAADDGVDIDGYYAWSLMDNLEWADGYRERFGLVYNDYETQQRIIKESGYFYRKVIESNGENL